MIELSIVIVSFNARADLERCLRSLHEAPPAASHEIIVIDNASTDGSAAAARAWPSTTVIECASNRGFSAANNMGIRASRGRYLLLLNSDTIVPGGAIDRLLRTLRDRPEATVVGPRLLDGNGQAELSFGRMLTPWNEFRQRRLVRELERGNRAARQHVDALTRREQWPEWVSGACLLVRREDAEAVGLLDERYFMYTEDVDFCAAIRAQGGRILFTPEVEIVHARGRSVASAREATLAARRRSRLAFYRKHHPWLAPIVGVYYRVFAGLR